MSNKTTSVILAGVGGQGVILAAELLALTAAAAGYDVKQSEVHGVSQRGGSVYSHVRFGVNVHSPLVPPGQADVLLGLEKLEALRFAHYLAPHGLLIVNDHEIPPASLGALAEKYPHHALDFLRDKGLSMLTVPATRMAEELGNVRVANVILLGALSRHLDIAPEMWERTLRERVPERHLVINLQAFAAGAAVSGQRSAVSSQQPAVSGQRPADSGQW